MEIYIYIFVDMKLRCCVCSFDRTQPASQNAFIFHSAALHSGDNPPVDTEEAEINEFCVCLCFPLDPLVESLRKHTL